MPASTSLRELCTECGSHLGLNPNCENCQEHAAAGATRQTAKVGGVSVQLGEPRAFSSSGRVD